MVQVRNGRGSFHLVTETSSLRFWAQFQFSLHVIDIKRGGIFPRTSHFTEAAEDVSRGPRSEPHNSWSAFLGPDVDSTTMLESYPISVVDPFIRSKVRTCGKSWFFSSDLYLLRTSLGALTLKHCACFRPSAQMLSSY
jgi:hypothetical protein